MYLSLWRSIRWRDATDRNHNLQLSGEMTTVLVGEETGRGDFQKLRDMFVVRNAEAVVCLSVPSSLQLRFQTTLPDRGSELRNVQALTVH